MMLGPGLGGWTPGYKANSVHLALWLNWVIDLVSIVMARVKLCISYVSITTMGT